MIFKTLFNIVYYRELDNAKQHSRQAFRIFKSLYLLDYIDSLPLRQNVQRALNRGESYHQLRRAISHANFGKLHFKSQLD